MAQHVLIGIDLGTTFLKAAAFDETPGRTLGTAGQRMTIRVAEGGVREISPLVVDRALREVLAALKGALGRDWQRVSGIGLAAQGGTTVISNRTKGKPLTPAILWNDTRSHRYASQVANGTTPAFWRRHTMRDKPGKGLARLLWIKEHAPELISSDNIYAGIGDYCYFGLTGLWRQDAGNAIQLGCYNARKQCLDQALFDLVKIPVSFVSPMRKGHETNPLTQKAAKRFGLPVGIPVAGPYMDHEAGFMSAMDVSAHVLQCSLGTAWVANFALPRNTRWTSPTQLVLPPVKGKGWRVVQPLATGNFGWDWALKTFVDPDHSRAIAKLPGIFARRILPPRGLTVLPQLNAVNPLRRDEVGAGVFAGLRLSTTSDDMVRAMAASMTYEMARMVHELTNEKRVDSVVLGGGASKGPFFRRLLAALFDPLPVSFLKEEDAAGPRGAVYPLSRKAGRAAVRRVRRPSDAFCREVAEEYAAYRDLFQRLQGKDGGVISFTGKRNVEQ